MGLGGVFTVLDRRYKLATQRVLLERAQQEAVA